ncbi:MAG: ankyrin repeat domain-containing protein, partial [Firmicutes bacterium]|nr:ankyrin repeat domain-containing protein [Bacillota bacterium]
IEKISSEIFEELKNKKYSIKEITKATTERSRYWANNFNKCRNLIEFEMASLCSYLIKLQQKMSNRIFSLLVKIICDRNFLSYENLIALPLFIIILHFFKTKGLIDPKHGNSLLKSYLTLLTQKKSLKGFKDILILESLERFFGNENDKISTLIKTLNNKWLVDVLKNEDTRISTYDLCLAMENCEISTFKKILEKSDKETKNGEYEGRTPLYLAIEEKKFDIVDILLEDKDILPTVSTLYLAIANCNIDTFKKLLEKADKICKNGLLGFAIQKNKSDIVNILLKADIEIITSDLHFAVKNCGKDIFEEILKRLTKKQKMEKYEGNTPLATAIMENKFHVVNILLEDEDIKIDPNGLYFAIKNCDISTFKKILNKSDQETKNEVLLDIIKSGIENNECDIFNILLEDKEIKINPYELSVAVKNCDKDIFEKILAKADKETKNEALLDIIKSGIENNECDIFNILLEDKEIKINQHELYIAVKSYDKDIFKKILKKADQETKNGEYLGRTPLTVAIEEKKFDIVDILSEDKDIKINPRTLCLAIKNCNIETFKKILNKSDQETKNREYLGKKPLTLAIEEKKFDIVDILLEDGSVKINQDELYIAVKSYDKDIFKKILKKADQETKNREYLGKKPLTLAIEEKKFDIVDILLEDKDIKINSYELYIAVKNCDKDTFEKLLSKALEDKDIKIDPRTLCLAIKNCNIETFKKILNKSDQETKNGEYLGDTPLTLAIEKNKLDIVDILLEDGDIKINPHAMCRAIRNCGRNTFKKILTKADKTAKNGEYRKETPLTIAIENSKYHSGILLDLLEDKTIEIDTRSLYLAVKNCDKDTFKKLLTKADEDKDIKIDPPTLCHAINNCDIETFKKILNKSDQETKNGEYLGDTPLTTAIEKNKFDIVDILLEDGDIKINPHAVCRAIKNCDRNTFKKILAKADETAKNGEYREETPLTIAIKNSKHHSGILLDLLEDKAIKIDTRALYLAVKNCDKDTFKKLLGKADKTAKTGKHEGMTPLDLAIRENKHDIANILSEEIKG